jgi:Flp pilus assembly protein TadG
MSAVIMSAVMKNFSFLTRLSHRITSLRRDQSGVSAVEFAMLLPLMVVLYLGAVEISQGVAIHRKVTLTARTVADLASQVTTINNAGMSNMLTAASAVVAPFPSNQLKVTVSAVTIDANGVATVAWSDSLNGTARAVKSTVPLPAALNVPNSQLIWSEVYYNYVPTIGYVVTGALNLFDQIYMRPRLSDTVNRTTS